MPKPMTAREVAQRIAAQRKIPSATEETQAERQELRDRGCTKAEMDALHSTDKWDGFTSH